MSIVRTRENFEAEELERLAPFASKSGASEGRLVAEVDHPYRTAFQRDRDRVVHSRAFRRLEYKTQVFVYHEGDHYRNRLTHTLEGAQIARTIARILRLNEDLAEAIALTHDLGHTPFGHAGERVLDHLLEGDGGFDHNRQTLRVVDWLESRYPDFRGLNLTLEAREGVLKHGCDWEHPVPLPTLAAQRSLESQVADIADEIAYVNHDLDDGLCAGLLDYEGLQELALWREAFAATPEKAHRAGGTVERSQVVIALINHLVSDVVAETARRLGAVSLPDLAAVRRHGDPLVGFSERVEREKLLLKRFLFEHFYNHPRVLATTRKAERVMSDLFQVYREDPSLLPVAVRKRFDSESEVRVIADYIAGMTDRYAIEEHRKLLDPHDLA